MAQRKPTGTPEEQRFAKAIELFLRESEWQRLTRENDTVYAYGIPSESRPGLYHTANLNACSCEDFTFNKQTCKHVIACRLYVDEKRREQQTG